MDPGQVEPKPQLGSVHSSSQWLLSLSRVGSQQVRRLHCSRSGLQVAATRGSGNHTLGSNLFGCRSPPSAEICLC